MAYVDDLDPNCASPPWCKVSMWTNGLLVAILVSLGHLSVPWPLPPVLGMCVAASNPCHPPRIWSGWWQPRPATELFIGASTGAQKYKLLHFTFNIPGLHSESPRLHTEIPCLGRQFLAFAVTFLSCTVNFLAFTVKVLAFTDNSSLSPTRNCLRKQGIIFQCEGEESRYECQEYLKWSTSVCPSGPP